jgi:hypothetical protein
MTRQSKNRRDLGKIDRVKMAENSGETRFVETDAEAKADKQKSKPAEDKGDK